MDAIIDDESMVTGYVYGLFDSRRPILLWDVRYIGMTTQSSPHVRLGAHISEAKGGRENYRLKWIRSVLAEGGKIVLKVLETHKASNRLTLKETLCERECVWIAEGRRQGWRLTNATDGGEGAVGYVPTEETRQRLSETQKGRPHSPEHVEKVAATHRGRRRSAETRSKIGAASKGRIPSVETLALLSQARTGSRNGRATLVEDDVREIRRLLASGMSRRDVREKFDTTAAIVYAIAIGRTWKHVI
jgi:hypothetical protein